MASFYGAQMSAMDNATRNAGEMIKQADDAVQSFAPGDDHQGTDRNHLGRGSALMPSSTWKLEVPMAELTMTHGTGAPSAMSNRATGRITQVIGAVVDVQVRGASAGNLERTRNDEWRQPPCSRSRATPRRILGALRFDGHFRRPRARPGGDRYRRARSRCRSARRRLGASSMSSASRWMRWARSRPTTLRADPSAGALLCRASDRGADPR